MVNMQNNQRLIVFLIPPQKLVNGGIMSIFSIARISRQFKEIHKSEVLLATYPGEKSYGKNDLFKNDETIYSFDEIVKRGPPQSLQIHIPEYASHDVFQGLKKYEDYLRAIPELSINIMNQNIWLMQDPADVANWFSLTPDVTQTIAHKKTATQEIANLYNLPSQHLSVFIDPSQYKWLDYDKKEDLIVLSPDAPDEKAEIVDKITKAFPSYKVVTVQNMTYEDYKSLMSKAKYTITFGEGFDGYYIESFLCGGIAFAVYNEGFFPDKEFSKFENLYSSYKDMSAKIIQDIKDLDRKNYEKIVKKNFDKITKLYDFSNYTKNIKDFYEKKYHFVPDHGSSKVLAGKILQAKDKIIAEQNAIIAHRDNLLEHKDRVIAQKVEAISERDKTIDSMINSNSWKVTKPLRKLSGGLGKDK